MTKDEQLLEIYKLHADLADRVSQRREGANRLYVTITAAIIIFSGTLVRFGMGAIPKHIILSLLASLAVFSILLCISWISVICSYRQLNKRKYAVLQELEKHISFPFFTKEEIATTPSTHSHLQRLTDAEFLLPGTLLATTIIIPLLLLYQLINS